MKESIGSIQLFIIVLTMVMLFSGIMAFTINRSNAFAVKDKIISIIEENGGIENLTNDKSKTIEKIVDSLTEKRYRQNGICPENAVCYSRDGTVSTSNAAFAIIKTKSTASERNAYYYKVVVYYNLDIPVIKTLFNFQLSGETKALSK